MGKEEAKPRDTSSLAEHPLMLTALVVYSIVLGLPLGKFPPIHTLQPTDLLIFSGVIILLMRTVLTYYYAHAEKEYPERLFFLEITSAFIFAGQFRVLLDDEINEPASHLWVFYIFHLALILTMMLWGRILGRKDYRVAPRLYIMRAVGASTAVIGLALERLGAHAEFLVAGRWIVASILLLLALLYAASRPWRQFQLRDVRQAC